jgi:3-hydroxymyristoyl/3-hydroxydecanoyl-(acyl carrier protein) dehydratase
MRISRAEIENYIPQREPFIMIDNLADATPERFETDFLILPGNIFVENGVLREFALIENIAQSSSAGLAITKIYSGKKNIDGFIGAISKLKLYDLPKVGDTINTVVNLLAQFENMFLLKGENFLSGKKLLECEIKLVGI